MLRLRTILAFGFLIALGWVSLGPVRTPAVPGREKKPSPETTQAVPGVLKSEANMVLINVIVTDKQGNYLRDMKRKDFHIFEDGKEQTITSFSREADIKPRAPVGQEYGRETEGEAKAKPIIPERTRYMVIFFDCTFMTPEDQLFERDQAVKFVESTGSLNRKMAVMDFGGTLRLDQDFTENGDLLKNTIQKVRFSPYATGSGIPPIGLKERNIRALRDLMQSIRFVAKTLGMIPGRKTMIYLSTGIPAPPELMSDFQDTVDALNKANVGVYTVAARGLEGPIMASAEIAHGGRGLAENSTPPGLRQLAAKTGGFAFVNKNDLQRGMEKVDEEINEYYILGYVPPSPVHDGSYHKIHVKIDRAGTEVRAREGYSDTKSPNLLVGKPEGSVLDAKASSFEAGEIPVTLSLPYFYVKPDVARVNLTLSIPVSCINFKKHGDDFHSQVNVLGIATREDGSMAARFSDSVIVNYRKDARPAKESPFVYQNSFKIAPGEYTLKVVLTAGGEKFGKYVVPLAVDPFNGMQFTLSGPAFGDTLVPCPLGSSDIDQALIEGGAPMVANGMQVVASIGNRFKRDSQPVAYVEVFDPLLENTNIPLGISFDIVNLKTKQKAYSSGTLRINQYVHMGNPSVPVIFKLPVGSLPSGDYRIEIQARDSAQNVSPVRTGDFSIE
jgi:VWFA-related protein